MDPTKDPPSTSDLVNRAQGGDREAFDKLAERYRSRLQSFAKLRIKRDLLERVEIDDVLQEIYLRAFQSLEQFEWRTDGCFYRWLAGIGRHVIQNLTRYHIQTEKRNPGREVPWRQDCPGGDVLDLGNLLQAKGTSPSNAMRRNERFEHLAKSLGQLSEDHREVLILARVEGLSTNEIAQRMGRSPAAVSMLVLRALRELKAIFGSTDSFHLPSRSLGHLGPEGPQTSSQRDGDLSGG